MTVKLIDLDKGARYRVLDNGEVVSISVSWSDETVHYENDVVKGNVPLFEFIRQVFSGSVEYIEPPHPTTYSKDIADLNNYGLDVSFVAVDEAAELVGPEQSVDSFDEVEATEAYADIKAELASPIGADEILQVANEAIVQRGVMYDSTGQQQERSMGKVVTMFNALTGHELTNEQGWKFMCLLKLARSEQGEFSLDSFIDLAAYAALAGEEAAKRNQQ